MFTRKFKDDDGYYNCGTYLSVDKINSIKITESMSTIYVVIATDKVSKIFKTPSDIGTGRRIQDTSFKLAENVI